VKSPPGTAAPRAEPTATRRPSRRQRRLDLALGILVGVVLGLCVIAAFVFLGSEGSIDAPRISGAGNEKPRAPSDAEPPAARQ